MVVLIGRPHDYRPLRTSRRRSAAGVGSCQRAGTRNVSHGQPGAYEEQAMFPQAEHSMKSQQAEGPGHQLAERKKELRANH
jgi:hypothetical protein